MDEDAHGSPDGDGRSEQVVEAHPVLAHPVLADGEGLERSRPASIPVVHAAALAATGFVAGAATVALLRRAGTRRLLRDQLERAALRELDGGEHAAAPTPVGRATYVLNVRLISRD